MSKRFSTLVAGGEEEGVGADRKRGGRREQPAGTKADGSADLPLGIVTDPCPGGQTPETVSATIPLGATAEGDVRTPTPRMAQPRCPIDPRALVEATPTALQMSPLLRAATADDWDVAQANELHADGVELDPIIADVHTQPTAEIGNPVVRVLRVGTGCHG